MLKRKKKSSGNSSKSTKNTSRKAPNFRSGLEKVIAESLSAALIPWKHESEKLKYIVPETIHSYLTDFSLPKHPSLILEAKGIFSSQDRKKMLLVKEQHPKRKILMIFGRAHNPIRKGSKTTNAMWCDKNEIAYLDLKEFKLNPLQCIKRITNG